MEDLMGGAAYYVLNAARLTVAQILSLIGPALVLGICMHGLSRAVESRAVRVFGRRGYLRMYGWLGTSVHELGHALFCPIFGHRIVAMQLFKPDPESGTLGYVRHVYNRRNPYHVLGNFFIGVGPLILGSLVIYGCAVLLVGSELLRCFEQVAVDADTFSSAKALAMTVGALSTAGRDMLAHLFSGDRLLDWKLYLFLYLVFSVGSAISLSAADLRGASKGGILIVGLLFAFNLTTNWVIGSRSDLISRFGASYAAIYSVLIIALILNGIAAAVTLLIPTSGRLAASYARNLRTRR